MRYLSILSVLIIVGALTYTVTKFDSTLGWIICIPIGILGGNLASRILRD